MGNKNYRPTAPLGPAASGSSPARPSDERYFDGSVPGLQSTSTSYPYAGSTSRSSSVLGANKPLSAQARLSQTYKSYGDSFTKKNTLLSKSVCAAISEGRQQMTDSQSAYAKSKTWRPSFGSVSSGAARLRSQASLERLTHPKDWRSENDTRKVIEGFRLDEKQLYVCLQAISTIARHTHGSAPLPSGSSSAQALLPQLQNCGGDPYAERAIKSMLNDKSSISRQAPLALQSSSGAGPSVGSSRLPSISRGTPHLTGLMMLLQEMENDKSYWSSSVNAGCGCLLEDKKKGKQSA